MKKSIVLFIVVLFCLFEGKTQASISGTVTDLLTNQPIPNAEIYFPSLNKKSFSSAKGEYAFVNFPKGNFLMQVRSVGYKPFMEVVVFANETIVKNIALDSSVTEFPEVVIYGNDYAKPQETSNNISSINAMQMRESGALTLSDGIAKLPGVSQLTTGNGISKPVIRGLFGNRIQTVLLGLRFDNQQFQDEHGLGLSDVGIDRVEVIKGAASLMYGSEAMGGVVNIIEEKPAAIGKTVSDISIRTFANTFGYSTDAGIRSANEKYFWRLRIGTDSHADYADGNNKRVLNSRFGGYYAKASFGFNKKKWISRNDYFFSRFNTGFLMDTGGVHLFEDKRLSRSFAMPHHTVMLNIVGSQNTFFLNDSKLNVNLGFNSNSRQEQEGGNQISLDMLLNTYMANATWVKELGERTEFDLGTAQLFQTNLNIGARAIIPDATVLESSAFAYFKHTRKYLVMETGVRYDMKNIQTFATSAMFNDPFSPGGNIGPFNKWFNAVNGSAGISLFDNKHWNVKVNTTSGYRPGNLAELCSNGLHEGTARFEIGNPDMKIEQNFCADISVMYYNKWISLSGSAYANRFLNYIYLNPTNDEYIGFQIFRYVQKNALLKGVEATMYIHPGKIKWFNFKSSYAVVVGTTDANEYLPYIPAQKITNELRVNLGKKSSNTLYLKTGADFVLAQTTPAQFETTTPAYWLLNAGTGWQKTMGKNEINISVVGNNLLNAVYYDHLSRFKYFNIYNMGRNISLNFKLLFN